MKIGNGPQTPSLRLMACMVMLTCLVACTDVRDAVDGQESEISQTSETSQEPEVSQISESSQTASAESTGEWMPLDVEDTLSRNCYQAFHGYVQDLKDLEWKGFQLSDLDDDKTDELIAVREDRESIKNGKQHFYVLDWEDHKKISVREVEATALTVSGRAFDELEYYDKEYMLLILNAEAKSYFEGVTKKDKDYFHLLTGIAWVEEGWANEPQERREGIEDYLIVSELGEGIGAVYSSAGSDSLVNQYRMRETDVVDFYKVVLGWEREFPLNYDNTSEIGVCKNEKNGYLYGENKVGWSDHSVITEIEQSEGELKVHAIVKSTYTDNRLADVTILLAPSDGKFKYVLTGYEVARETGVDLETGQVLEELQEEHLHVRYIMQRVKYADRLTPVIREMSYMENDTELFTANAKRLLSELKKEYEANPGSDGSNIAAKSTLLGIYDFADNSKILIFEDAAYGNVPPATGSGSEYGYCLSYHVLTPGDRMNNYGEIFHYDESFGDMPADRKGMSRFRHYFLGVNWQGEPSLSEFVATTKDFAKEFMFCAGIGRSHDMTMDAEGWENYDEDHYLYYAYFGPDGERIVNQYATWQVATWEYVSHGAFIKDPKGKTLFEEGSGAEGYGYYVEGKYIPIDKKQEGTEEIVCDLRLDETTKLCGKIRYRDWENIMKVDLIFYVDGKEVSYNLYSYKFYW